MKIFNIKVNGGIHAAVEGVNGIVDAALAGFEYSTDEAVSGKGLDELEKIAADSSLPAVKDPVFANVLNMPGKLLCIGLNYAAHANATKEELPGSPTVFCKFPESLAACGAGIFLPPWEDSYDYEAELVAILGREAFNVSEEEAEGCIFGYACGNDLSLRAAQKRTSQWLVGKALPDFGPCGPCIVTADSIDPKDGLKIQSYMNGELRQNGNTADMIFSCAQLISYISKYIPLKPGDMIFTGTPSGVIMEKPVEQRVWIRPGDKVDVVIEGIGTLTNTFI